MDRERSKSRPARPLTACSMGKVTSCSTSLGERPGHSVWTVTCGGANSGKTSSLAREAATAPATINRTAKTTTTTRLRSDQSTSAWSMLVVRVGAEFRGQQVHGTLGHDRIAVNQGAGDDARFSLP